MGLVSSLVLTAKGTYTSALDLSTATDPLSFVKTISLANGSGASQADLMWHDQRTLAASTAEDLDIDGGGLTDAFGAAVAFDLIKALYIYAATGNTNNVQVGGDANSVPIFGATADFISIPPGGFFAITAPDATGIAVTAGTGDIIQVENSAGGTSVTYDIVIIGVSA